MSAKIAKKMERSAFLCILLLVFAISSSFSHAADSAFDGYFSKTCPDTHFQTSEDGQIWNLAMDKDAGTYTCSLIPLNSVLCYVKLIFTIQI